LFVGLTRGQVRVDVVMHEISSKLLIEVGNAPNFL
jgi:hypothetical protein